MYPIEKYRFVQTGNKTIAISTYAGKTVRGIAKCDPRDTANVETGKTIAALRCAQKIARRRVARSDKKVCEAAMALAQARRRYESMIKYHSDAMNAQMEVDYELDKLLG